MSQQSKFKAAAKKASRLYKTGKYKTFADAMKVALKKGKSVGAAKKKNRQTGTSNKKRDSQRKAKRPGLRTSKSGRKYVERRKNRSDAPGSLTGLKATAKSQLAKALLDYELATTIKGTKEAQARKIKYRKVLRTLK